MCQFAGLWRSFTCGQLEKLLDENWNRNLPHMIRAEREDVINDNQHLSDYFTFIAVAYREKLPQRLPGLFANPIEGDALAFAEVRVFVPKRRIAWRWHQPSEYHWGGWLGPGSGGEEEQELPEGHWRVGWQGGVSEGWDLWNQHWTTQIVPTTQPALVAILQTPPPLPQLVGAEIRLPDLGELTTEDVGRISPH